MVGYYLIDLFITCMNQSTIVIGHNMRGITFQTVMRPLTDLFHTLHLNTV